MATKVARSGSRLILYRAIGCFRETTTLDTKQGRITVSTRDNVISKYMFCDRQYEFDSSRRTVQFLRDSGMLPHGGGCMLDVGANIGMISTGLLLSKDVERSIAIEPESGNFSLLQRNVEQNSLSDRMTCLQLAVGETESMLTLEISASNPGDHRIRSTPTGDAEERLDESSRTEVQVPSLPLGQILAKPEVNALTGGAPSLLWIDVQGHEGHVFKGGAEILRSGFPTVSEVWPYGIRRSGMSLEEFASIVQGIWTDYWVERRGRFVRYPISVFDRYLDEIDSEDHFENVVFTNASKPSS